MTTPYASATTGTKARADIVKMFRWATREQKRNNQRRMHAKRATSGASP